MISRGSPLWDFTFTRRVAAPAVTLLWSLSTISLRTSASVVLARLSFAPNPIHLCIDWREASYPSGIVTSSHPHVLVHTLAGPLVQDGSS